MPTGQAPSFLRQPDSPREAAFAVASHASARWIVCQIGARENYAVARALDSDHRLEALLTDAWISRRFYKIARQIFPRLAERGHDRIDDASVAAPTLEAMARETITRSFRVRAAKATIARNRWFQRKALAALPSLGVRLGAAPCIVFAYSYAAREIFEYAHSMGWKTVLGQIDPGRAEAKLVENLHMRYGLPLGAGAAKSEAYWRSWHEETRLADAILVNSDWSRDALVEEGVAAEKIAVVPLAYVPPPEALNRKRILPQQFSRERPLRVLFLGQIILRKGIYETLQAIKLLEDAPVEFHFVGAAGLPLDESVKNLPNVRWHGSKRRSEVHRYYQDADVFLFPTHSDGFGLTQLEALSWGLPVIASSRCGNAVRDSVNGLMLSEVTPAAISSALLRLARSADLVAHMSDKARSTPISSIEDLCTHLIEIEESFGLPS